MDDMLRNVVGGSNYGYDCDPQMMMNANRPRTPRLDRAKEVAAEVRSRRTEMQVKKRMTDYDQWIKDRR